MGIVEQLVEVSHKLEPLLKSADFNVVVNVMSNHQRNQWARAGYPGLRQKDPTGPAKFIPSTKLLHRLEKESTS